MLSGYHVERLLRDFIESSETVHPQQYIAMIVVFFEELRKAAELHAHLCCAIGSLTQDHGAVHTVSKIDEACKNTDPSGQ